MNNLHPIALRPETEPEHPLTYRQEIASPLFQRLRAGESGVIIGAASMGKSRLLQFIQRRDVQRHYLAAMAESTLLIAADCNRLAAFSAWALHELLLTALIEASGEYEQTRDLSERLYQWRNEAIRSRSRLLTQRHVELALHIFCKERGLRIGFILDEFDEAYRRLPSQALANLRALRDQHKYQLSYLLFTRDDPKYLRNPDQCEGFYELISRGVNGLSPYGEEDGRRVIQQICARRYHEVGHLEESILRALLQLSGGHPGLIAALLDAYITSKPIGITWHDWATSQPKADEECRKLWEGLRKEERNSLHQLAIDPTSDSRPEESLLLKGLIYPVKDHSYTIFSPLLAAYALNHSPEAGAPLRVDAQAREIYIHGKRCERLANREWDLFILLYQHLGEVCEQTQIAKQLNPSAPELETQSGNITAIVRRIRKKIEPDATLPRFLRNIPGQGYQLVDEPDQKG